MKTSKDQALDKQRVRSILVTKFKNIGDVLLLTPALEVLRKSFPHATISVFVNDFTADMLRGNEHIDNLLILDRKKVKGKLLKGLLYEWHIIRKIRALKPDLLIDCTGGDRSARYALFSGASIRIAYQAKAFWKRWSYNRTLTLESTEYHQVLRDLDLVYALVGSKNASPELHLTIDPEDNAWAREQMDSLPHAKTVHIHPVARWLYKCWHDDRMACVIDWLQQEKACNVIVTCGPEAKEIARAEHILSLCKHKPTAFLGTITLKQLAAISSNSHVFLGVDTAPMHMAAATKVPMIALFGPTGVDWHPWSEQATVLRGTCHRNLREAIGDASSLIDVEVDAVKAQIEKHL